MGEGQPACAGRGEGSVLIGCLAKIRQPVKYIFQNNKGEVHEMEQEIITARFFCPLKNFEEIKARFGDNSIKLIAEELGIELVDTAKDGDNKQMFFAVKGSQGQIDLMMKTFEGKFCS